MVTITSLAFVIAALCAALMGFAIQRGATCAVAAVAEIAHSGSTNRLVALGETALWVAGCMFIARVLGLLPALPGGYALTAWTVVGGALLGFGAFVNRACVFGAIANLGSGQFAYALTPVGFYIGVATLPSMLASIMPQKMGLIPDTAALPNWIAPLFAAYALWRLGFIVVRLVREKKGWRDAWGPHEATLVIGMTFALMFVIVGAWAYTDFLAQVAHQMADGFVWKGLLFASLLLGAGLGGWSAGRFLWQKPAVLTALRCLIGGILMGLGSTLIPGGNDGLILLGMPFLWPYAWVAILAMCVTIWVGFKVEERLKAR
jgi:hypothetical protein